jgi:hypothetical protein
VDGIASYPSRMNMAVMIVVLRNDKGEIYAFVDVAEVVTLAVC